MIVSNFEAFAVDYMSCIQNRDGVFVCWFFLFCFLPACDAVTYFELMQENFECVIVLEATLLGW